MPGNMASSNAPTNYKYLMPLRKEISQHAGDEFPHSKHLPLLDSIMQESARLNSSETITLRRKATSKYTFSDGMKVEKGRTVYAPLRAMGRDLSHFHDPESFIGDRFLQSGNLKPKDSTKGSEYTDITAKYPYWGYGIDSW
ncbi:hypothetical protein HYALB_00006839 [Hymenoscyphus albidus]|uniref:Uncharacterized protein n=1 Tax=Hymenoscyphus albidus TaxID=595503 RepID=A0A9N9PRR3_9HELO|nr:hypothetical protein HYALB_00006839 [Hymenoscyphus albidus]